MSEFKAELRSLATGRLPHTNPADACQLVIDNLDIPAWPQLPRFSFLENMYVQFSERFPGVKLSGERIYLDRERDFLDELANLDVAYLMNDLPFAAISPDYAAGLHHFLQMDLGTPSVVKGQVTGPISWGLMVADQNRQAILGDEVLAEVVARHLRLKASWEEQELRGISPQTIIFVDEPFLSSFGSDLLSLGRERVISLLEEVFAGIEGLKGVHCCGTPDWSLVLSTTVDILNLDAYENAESLALYVDEVAAFLDRGGVIAWGIVPASDLALEETVDGLVDRFHAAIGTLSAKGLCQDDLLASALITPSCGCGALPVQTAERVYALTRGVSTALQERYA
jgi:hypothetical protein